MLHIEQFKKYYTILHGGVEGMGDSEGMDFRGGKESENIILYKGNNLKIQQTQKSNIFIENYIFQLVGLSRTEILRLTFSIIKNHPKGDFEFLM